MIERFRRGSQRDLKVSVEFRIAALARAFGDIRGDGERGATELRPKRQPFSARQAFCDSEYLERDRVSLRPDFEPPEILHGSKLTNMR
jgi:hypothetical protein